MDSLKSMIFLGLMSLPLLAQADAEEQLSRLLNSPETPAGVVFEIVEGKQSALEWAIPMVKDFSQRLRAKFPDIDIAVVSHGKEEFALLTENREKYAAVHKTVQQLVKDDNIPVHVCGTHASWYQKVDEDFPDYVDVAPVGPAQIRQYEDLGYTLIELEKPR